MNAEERTGYLSSQTMDFLRKYGFSVAQFQNELDTNGVDASVCMSRTTSGNMRLKKIRESGCEELLVRFRELTQDQRGNQFCLKQRLHLLRLPRRLMMSIELVTAASDLRSEDSRLDSETVLQYRSHPHHQIPIVRNLR